MNDKIRNTAIIALGANLQEPAAMIQEALRRLDSIEGLTLIASSKIYLTEPQGGPADQDWFHNAVATFDTNLSAHQVLKHLLSVELDMGRRRLITNGPRLIDLDLLALGELIINEPPDLILPHPRASQRLFVMAPLAELLPNWVHPLTKRTALEIMAEIPQDGQECRCLG